MSIAARPAKAEGVRAAPAAPSRCVVLAIGNVMLGDEALGVRALERFARQYAVPEGVELLDGGTSAMELLDEIAGCGLLVVVDAVLAGTAPGTPVRLAGDAVPRFFRAKLSPHQIGLSDVLASLEFCGELPARTVVLGLEPASLRLGLELTDAVHARLPELADRIAAELRSAGIAVTARAVQARG